jgi:hypothetical protein
MPTKIIHLENEDMNTVALKFSYLEACDEKVDGIGHEFGLRAQHQLQVAPPSRLLSRVQGHLLPWATVPAATVPPATVPPAPSQLAQPLHQAHQRLTRSLNTCKWRGMLFTSLAKQS